MADTDNLVTLKEYFERMMAAHTEANDARFDNIRQATELAAKAVEARLQLLNEFKAAMDADRNRFATMDKLESETRSLKQEIGYVREELNVVKAQLSNLTGRLVAYGAVVVILIGVALKFLT